MGKVIMAATVSLDGFIADHSDAVGPLFDWYGNGDVEVTGADHDRVFRMSQVSADYVGELWPRVAAVVIGRHLFDITNGWHGRPAVGEAVFVVTHQAPVSWPYQDAPFTFVTDGIHSAIAQAKAFAGDRDVSITAGDVGGQAFAAGLVDEIDIALVPVVFGTGVRFFGTFDKSPALLDDPQIVQGNRVTHLRYRVRQADSL